MSLDTRPEYKVPMEDGVKGAYLRPWNFSVRRALCSFQSRHVPCEPVDLFFVCLDARRGYFTT